MSPPLTLSFSSFYFPFGFPTWPYSDLLSAKAASSLANIHSVQQGYPTSESLELLADPNDKPIPGQAQVGECSHTEFLIGVPSMSKAVCCLLHFLSSDFPFVLHSL